MELLAKPMSINQDSEIMFDFKIVLSWSVRNALISNEGAIA